ncbi:hypothetical protein [Endozoicomonas sp. 4G]|uniref:hypothetical protein n=1 Tax=Endozoicomonas sp. 4G TaxID=2872754 RepID=UPI00207868C2|nr:hypothetical protein [Endozoicomonas sp. 4G]
MNPVTEICLQADLALTESVSSGRKELATNQLTLDKSYQTQVNNKWLSERKVSPANQLIFHDEEFFIEVRNKDFDSHIFPFSLNGIKYHNVTPDLPVLEKDFSGYLSFFEEVVPDSDHWIEAKKRLSNIFTEGFENVCKTLWNFQDDDSVVSGCCHQFVNYLAFGMDRQSVKDFNGWYESLPFASVQEFDQEKLRWGDIVQLLSDGKLIHSLFYIGNGKYINKHGGLDIFFQALPSVQVSYPSDSVRIVRLAPEYYSKKIPFQAKYGLSTAAQAKIPRRLQRPQVT